MLPHFNVSKPLHELYLLFHLCDVTLLKDESLLCSLDIKVLRRVSACLPADHLLVRLL